MTHVRRIRLIIVLVWPLLTQAQEVKYIELSFVQQRTELRHPPAPPPECNDGKCIGGGIGGGSVGDGAPDHRDPHALGVYIIAVPIIVLTEIFGYTRFQPLNTVLGCFGFFSLSVAVFNLIPAPPLDGSVAWGLLPALFRRPSAHAAKRELGWRSWR